MSLDSKSVSPSRQYVAMCNKTNFDGYYFRKFTLPEQTTSGHKLENNNRTASWYFLNVIDYIACIQGCIAYEDYQTIHLVDENSWKCHGELQAV